MKESVMMLEIREIRDKNSLRHISMTSAELAKEYEESTKRFITQMGMDIKIVSLANLSN